MIKINQKTDAELVQEFMNGNEVVFNILIKKYQDPLRRLITYKLKTRSNFSYGVIGQISEDISQDTFIKAFLSLRKGNYKEESHFKSWLYTIAHNLCMDYHRKGKRMPLISIASPLSSSPRINITYNDFLQSFVDTQESKIIDFEISLKLRELIQDLPIEQRDVLVMRIFQDIAFKDIAERMDTSINTSLGRMRYALINLRKKINEKGLQLHTI